jgi:nucleoside-diphosphate-sugar epimerase
VGYLESALTVPIETDAHVIYLPCHVHGGRAEMVDDVARLARTLDTLGGRRLVFASTAALYDGRRYRDAPRERARLPEPVGWYQLTKRTQEDMIRLSGADAVILRLGAIVGPAPVMRWDLLPNAMVWRAVTTGEIPVTMPRAMRPMLGINDAVRAVQWALTAEAGVYNIATANWNVRSFATVVAGMCGATIVEPGEPDRVPSLHTACARRARRTISASRQPR